MNRRDLLKAAVAAPLGAMLPGVASATVAAPAVVPKIWVLMTRFGLIRVTQKIRDQVMDEMAARRAAERRREFAFVGPMCQKLNKLAESGFTGTYDGQ